jgi:hypothetical protein
VEVYVTLFYNASVSPSSSPPPPSESEQIEQLRKQLQWAELKIRVLEERLRLELIAKYGPASEKLSDAQLELLQLEPGVSSVEVQAESEREPEPALSNKSQKAQTSRTPGTAGGLAAPRENPSLHPGTMHLSSLRAGNDGDRLRAERAVGCGTSQIFCAGHQTRETCLPLL